VAKLRGFTLIELLVVLALVVIVTGLVTVRFVGSVQERSLEQYVREMSAYLRFLQFKAIEDGNVLKIFFNEETKEVESMKLEKESQREDGRKNKKKEFVPMKTPFSQKANGNKDFGIRLKSGDEIYFFPDGSVTKNTVIISDQVDERATIEIKNRLGLFKVNFNEKTPY